MQKLFRVTVDISKKIPAPAFEVNTNDLKSVKLEITITNGQSLLDLTDVTPRINIRKPDNEVIFQDCEIVDAKSGKIQIVLENQAYLVPGTHTAEIMCYKGSDVVAVTGTFSYKSTKGIMNDEAVESKSEFTAIDRKIAEARKLLEDIGENGVGVDEQARQEIQQVTEQLAGTVKEINGVKPTNGKVTLPIPEVDTSNLRTKTEKLRLEDMSPETLAAIEGGEGTTFNLLSIPQENSVSISKLSQDFRKVSSNIYNPDEKKDGFYINPANGNETAGSSFEASGFMAGEPGSTKYIEFYRHIAFYDKDKKYVGTMGDSSTKRGAVITFPANAYYFRISWGKSDAITTQQVNNGSTKLPYEPFYQMIKKEVVEKHPVTPSDIPPIDMNKIAFAEKGTNLFNRKTLIQDTTINVSTGAASTATGFVASDFEDFPLGSKNIIVKYARAVAVYDANKIFLKGKENTVATANYVMSVPDNAKYVRISWYPSGDKAHITPETQQINVGTTLKPYEEYGYKIPARYVSSSTTGNVETISPSITMPSEIYGVVGEEINVYFDNIANVSLKDYQIDVTGSLGKQMADKWTATPTKAGNYNLNISLYKDYKAVVSTSTTFIVKDKTVGTDSNKKALVIGDSTVTQDWMVRRAEARIADDPLNVTFIGTLGTYGLRHHEGRAGWTMAQYRTNDTYNSVVNPFYNPAKSDFDFGYYMTNQGFDGVDYVAICLGINDVFSFQSDNEVLGAIPGVIDNFVYAVNSIKAYNANIKIGIYMTVPPNASQDAFGEAYFTGQTQWRYKRNNGIWIQKLVDRFDKRKSENIYIIPDNPHIDAVNGFRDGVHPNEAVGDRQRGDTLYWWLKSFES